MPHLWLIYLSSFIVFMFIYLISFIIVMMCNDWFLIWFGLEINMLSFIILVYDRNSMMNIEACLKYFFVQGLGSALLLGLFYLDYLFMYFMSFVILTLKIAAGPFYFWFPSVCSGLSWFSCYMLMIFQKVIPLMMISMFVGIMFWLIILLSLIIGAIGSFNQSDLKRLMAYSSIHHLGWILIAVMIKSYLWIMYLLIYSVIILNVLFMFNYYNLIDVNMIGKCKNKFFFMLNVLSMGGMPPMLGFFLKWMVFSYLLSIDYYLVMFMLLMSVLMFYVYFRFMYDVIIMNSNYMNWLNYNNDENVMIVDIFSILGSVLGIFFIINLY